MTPSEKHCKTKLCIQMFQIEWLFDSCNDAEKISVISEITGNGCKNDEELVPMTIEDIRSLFSGLTDDQRLELIKSIVWTAPDMYKFHKKAEKMIKSNEFQETLD